MSGQPPKKQGISADVRLFVYQFLKPSELILVISKLSQQERLLLKDRRDEDGYAMSSSIGKKKTMFNTFDSNM